MKKLLLTQILFFVSSFVVAQNLSNSGNQFSNNPNTKNIGKQQNDTTKEIEEIPPKLYMWHLDEKLGTILPMPADTINYNFQNTNLTEGMNGHYNFLGNLGSPRLSRLFFERTKNSPTIFTEPYSFFIIRPGDFKFTNSNVPYTNLSYYSGGGNQYGEDRFKSYFSVNVNKYFAFGFNFDYLYGRGFYNNQSTAFFNGSLFGSYIGDRYEASFIYSNNFLKMNENGGITDDRYITNPEQMSNGGKDYEPQNIPTNLDESNNRNRDYYVFLTHRYKLGFRRKIKVITVDNKKTDSITTKDKSNSSISPKNSNAGTIKKDDKKDINKISSSLPKTIKNIQKKDSIIEEFVPVTSFIHTMQFEHTFHRFHSEDNVSYTNTYFSPTQTEVNDTTSYTGIKNTFGIALLEGFNKYAKAGLTAYISHKLSQYTLMDIDSTKTDKYSENEVYVGGELSKRQGKTFHYVFNGEIGLLGKAISQFNIKGNIDLNIRFLGETFSFIGRGFISNTLPDFYIRNYHSKHFYWNNNLNNEFRTHVEGELSLARLQTNLKVGVENIKNYTYFNENALPTQESNNLQVISATLNQNFHLGILHLDNEITWQKSTNSNIISLPDLSLYHNLYIETTIAKKVLHVQLGADVRYFTPYYALAYTPAIQQFNLQNSTNHIKLGAYPIINVYANFQLKRTRFFAMFYHANKGMGNSMYFLVPHYPIDQRVFKIGLSWNFYD